MSFFVDFHRLSGIPSFIGLACTRIYTISSSLIINAKNLIWDSNDPVANSEDRFLRCLTHRYYRYYVHVSDSCSIWTLSSVPPPWENIDERNEDIPPVVLIHGLASGLAYWVMNIDSMTESGHDVYAIDLPGFSRSSRISFSDDGLETEQIFIDIINQWRQKLDLNQMILIGHSFGGYLCTLYSLHYPASVIQVILVDPWGFPDVCEEVTAVVEMGNFSLLPSSLAGFPVWIRILAMILTPFSPFTILRILGGRIGPKLVHMMRPDMALRYAKIFGDDDQFTVPQYIYHTNNFPPTGERAFRSVAMSLAWAKRPLIKRIARMNKNISFHLIYGSHSWVDFQTGFEVKEILSESIVNVYVIDGAGHHLFADEPEKFNSLIYSILKGEIPSSLQFYPCHDISDNPLCIKDVSMK